MTNKKSALLAGASGLVGGHCLQMLLNDPAYSSVNVLVRKLLPVENAKLSQHIIDFDYLDNHIDLIKADDIFCCLGTTIKKAGSQSVFRKVDFSYPDALAKIAATNGASRFLMVTALGADANSRIFYNQVKGEVEKAIQKYSFISIFIFRPSLLTGQRREFRISEKIGEIASFGIKGFMVGSLRKYRPIKAKAVACAMVQAAKQDDPGIHIYESDQIQKIYNSHNQ